MAIFGKKKSKEEEYEDDEEFEREERRDSLEERKLRKQLRDLKAENRKKRKEPSKPWGRRERVIILIILGATILISAVLTISSRGVGGVSFSGFHLDVKTPNFGSLNIFKEQTIEIKRSGTMN